MGMLDKLKFWKHEDDEFDFGGNDDLGMPGGTPGSQQPGMPPPGGLPGEPSGQDFGLGPTPGDPGALSGQQPRDQQPMGMGQPQSPGFGSQQPPGHDRVTPAYNPSPQAAPAGPSRDIEVLNMKLDSIRNTLENINIRLERIEKIARGEEQHEQRQW